MIRKYVQSSIAHNVNIAAPESFVFAGNESSNPTGFFRSHGDCIMGILKGTIVPWNIALGGGPLDSPRFPSNLVVYPNKK